MSGFWAGAVPPWAYAVGACLVILGILLGVWAGYGRGFAHAEEEARWAREQVKARRTHPVYRQPGGGTVDPWHIAPPELAHETPGPEDRRGDAWGGFPAGHGSPVTTGEIQAITDETDVMVARWRAENDVWLAEHVYSAPADYGQWLEQQDR